MGDTATIPEQRDTQRRAADHMYLIGPVTGRVIDINRTGLGVETEEPLAVMKRKQFSYVVGHSSFDFLGEVRWCKFTGSIPVAGGDHAPVYRAGIAMVKRREPNRARGEDRTDRARPTRSARGRWIGLLRGALSQVGKSTSRP